MNLGWKPYKFVAKKKGMKKDYSLPHYRDA